MDEVRWTPDALRDLDALAAYIALENPGAAETVVRRIVEAVSGLGYWPLIGRPGRVARTRELVVSGTPYIAVYRVHTHVEILSIYHGARRWPESF